MTKLNKRKIDWIVRELERGELSIRQIAKVQKISPRRVRQLREHKETHMSLDFENLETPAQAFKRKMHHKSQTKQAVLLIEVKR